MQHNKTNKIYSIQQNKPYYQYWCAAQKLNCTISNENKINIHFSAITRASNGGTLYFIDKRTCQKYYNLLMAQRPDCGAEIHIARKHTRNTIHKIAPGIYISKNTTYYQKLNKGD